MQKKIEYFIIKNIAKKKKNMFRKPLKNNHLGRNTKRGIKQLEKELNNQHLIFFYVYLGHKKI